MAHYDPLFNLLRPFDTTKYNKIRIGNQCDGGYVLLDIFKDYPPSALYSYGVANDVSFEVDFVNRYDVNMPVYLYDHTIYQIPPIPDTFTYYKQGIDYYKHESGLLDTLENQVKKDYNNMVLKMDVENAEWRSLLVVPDETLLRFSQLAIEFHSVYPDDYFGNSIPFDLKVELFKKLNRLFYIVHAHINNCGTTAVIQGRTLPSVLELTLVRRDILEDDVHVSTTSFPTEYDAPNSDKFPELPFFQWQN